MQPKRVSYKSSKLSVVLRLGQSLSAIAILVTMLTISCMQAKGVSATLLMKGSRFSIGLGRAGVKSFLLSKNYSPMRSNTLMMSTATATDANAAVPKKGKGKKKEGESKYGKTVLLPITSFDQRANSLKRYMPIIFLHLQRRSCSILSE